MSDEKKQLRSILTPEGRLSFPALFAPKAQSSKPGSKLKFQATILIPKGTDITALRELALEAGQVKFGAKFSREKFGPQVIGWPGGAKMPIRDGDDLVRNPSFENRPEYRGHWVVACRNDNKPGIVGPDAVVLIDEKAVYAGSYGRAYITAFGYDQDNSKGVSFSLQAYQKTRDGESFGASMPDATKVFQAAAGASAPDEDDPLG